MRDIDSGSSATIIELNATIGQQREKLLKQASGSVSKEKLQIAPDNQPVVSVRFGKNSHLYDYALVDLGGNKITIMLLKPYLYKST